MPDQTDITTLVDFLSYPLGSSDAVFERFSSIPNADRVLRGRSPERFIYLPGSRKNKVLLVAHADTVWAGKMYLNHTVQRCGDVLRSSNPAAGLGADDRGGCAIIWLLRNLGHSILITDGEEMGRMGSRYLLCEYDTLASDIQKQHQFMVQFDRRNGTEFKCYNVGSAPFREYLVAVTDYHEPDFFSYSDIVSLCTKITGVNISIGYRNEHSADECLHLTEWLATLNMCRDWLSQENLPKFFL